MLVPGRIAMSRVDKVPASWSLDLLRESDHKEMNKVIFDSDKYYEENKTGRSDGEELKVIEPSLRK